MTSQTFFDENNQDSYNIEPLSGVSLSMMEANKEQNKAKKFFIRDKIYCL